MRNEIIQFQDLIPSETINPLDGISYYGIAPPSRYGPRSKSARSLQNNANRLIEKANGELVLPKTYLTRKGAIVLFTAPDNLDLETNNDDDQRKVGEQMFDITQNELNKKFGNLTRFAQSVLSYGDEVKFF